MTRAASREPFPLVELTRATVEPGGRWHGFVVAESPALVAIHHVSERFDFDGYRVFPRDTITRMTRRFDARALIVTALRLKRLAPAAPRALDLTSVRALVASIDAAYPLVVIHRERISPDECEIGRLRLHTDETYVLDWMTPQATWELDQRRFRFADVTRVDFDSGYENTLAMVAAARGQALPPRRARPQKVPRRRPAKDPGPTG